MANHLLLLALTIFNLRLVISKTPPPPPTTHSPPPPPTTRPPPPSKSLRPPPQLSKTFPPPPPSISVSPPPQFTDFIPTPSNKAFSPPPPPPPATVSPPPSATVSPPPAKVFSPPPASISISPPPQSTDFIPTPSIKAFSPPPPATVLPPPSATVSPPLPIDGETTIEKIIDAITTNQTEFGIWAKLLLSSSSSTTSATATATLFIPSNAAFSHLPTPTTAAINFDPFLIPYHISPTRLSFHHLLHQFKPNSTIPTLLPSKSILITNTSPLNFTIDNSRITRPDIYLSPAFAVHGIQHILDYTLFGDLHFPATTSPPLIPPLDELVGATTTTSDCSAAQLPLFFSFLCAAFAFNML